ncbi:hypothetical protein [Streptomyces laurentii]|uniref:hypothetical protein n=1 Tax=Streptomyces laurentii TaxID=39478 RepID=UPI00369F2F26
MEQLAAHRPVPGPGFVTTLLTSTWLDATSDAAPLAWLLVAHAGPWHDDQAAETSETVEPRLMGMVDSLGLAPASKPLPHIGGRVIVRASTAALYYGHPMTVLRLPHASRRWRSHLALGGTAVIALGLDPLAPGTGRDGIEAYLHRGSAADRLYLGTAALRRRRA